ncbi:MAG TPA: 30S ribosomal protein S5 [Candidatus Acidoferrum sp.]
MLEVNPSDLKDDVIAINRVTKVVKGGKNLSFSALVVVGDHRGHAGFGMGKAREVPMAIKKAIEQAKKNLIKLNMKGTTIPHQVLGRYGSAQVLLKPAPDGTGVIAGGPVRKVMQISGIHNVLTKSLGTSNPHNVIKATFAALLSLKDIAQVAETRSKTVDEISGRQPREKAAVGENN